MTSLIDWTRVERWAPSAVVIAGLLGLLVLTAGSAHRAQREALAATAERERIGAHLNATQQIVTHLQARLAAAEGRVCQETVAVPTPAVRVDVGHDTPIFGRW